MLLPRPINKSLSQRSLNPTTTRHVHGHHIDFRMVVASITIPLAKVLHINHQTPEAELCNKTPARLRLQTAAADGGLLALQLRRQAPIILLVLLLSTCYLLHQNTNYDSKCQTCHNYSYAHKPTTTTSTTITAVNTTYTIIPSSF